MTEQAHGDRDRDEPIVKPEYEEDHPAPLSFPDNPTLIEDLRPEVEGATIPERNLLEAEEDGETRE